ncbi:hypothetical protein T12_6901 [Trichinella patagoniensis]|uniref:Uncharacterized protein n=1 Tax=Trichinella patagoniensis TaxID=990121 RepID=A0A0V1A3Z7_9BILA|nr:hypothetical protein T12_6901 [Trichinella patagoniensis]
MITLKQSTNLNEISPSISASRRKHYDNFGWQKALLPVSENYWTFSSTTYGLNYFRRRARRAKACQLEILNEESEQLRPEEEEEKEKDESSE